MHLFSRRPPQKSLRTIFRNVLWILLLGLMAGLLWWRLEARQENSTTEASQENVDNHKADDPDTRDPVGGSYAIAREAMVREQIEGRGVDDPNVLVAMRNVPRHKFVLEHYLSFAYDDTPLPINYGQTISQPYMVAWMSELLHVQPGDRVLEIGTGSGYQAAILAEMGIEVYSIEIIPELAQEAQARLENLGYDQVHLMTADGYFGWEAFAPYQAIIVTAAPDHLPQPLIGQLAESGRLVIPIGPVGAVQTLWLFEKQGEDLGATNMGAVRFVPLTGEH
jgi:protein-L-isoaspartate(D-aspartate) O-methyltransferase